MVRLIFSIVDGLLVMKNAKTPNPTESQRRQLSLWDLVRFGALLTLGSTIAIFVTASVQGNHEVWAIASMLCLWTTLVVWIVALTIGCLVMVPVGIWRLGKRLARKSAEKTIPQGRVWDRWIDGPEPS
jgi:hypothetical protein